MSSQKKELVKEKKLPKVDKFSLGTKHTMPESERRKILKEKIKMYGVGKVLKKMYYVKNINKNPNVKKLFGDDIKWVKENFKKDEIKSQTKNSRYEKRTVKELQEIAKEKDVKYSGKKKSELIEDIRNSSYKIVPVKNSRMYNQNTVKELRELAKSKGLKNYSKLKKNELVMLLSK